jgi:molybdenum cofactor sulfurtransferase
MLTLTEVDVTRRTANETLDYTAAFQSFLQGYPTYAHTAVLDEVRQREYSRLDHEGHIYLDYTGGGLHAASQVQRHLDLLNSHVFGNPHSQNPTSLAMTARVEQAREAVLRHFNAPAQEYVVIFTPNASGALKLVGEAYPFTPNGHYLLTADNHNSVNGVRQFAAAKGAAITHIPVIPPELRLNRTRVAQALELATPGAPNLFAFPAQSNYSGVQHPLDLVETAHTRGWDVLLDAAAYAPTNRLDLTVCQPDFVSVSFYKILGYPTGIGCLLARRAALARLARPWFAGGAISFASVRTGRHLLAPAEVGFEDGTVNYLTIPAVETGLQFLNEISIDLIHNRVAALTGWLIEALLALRHDSGRPLVYLHGPRNLEQRGGTVTMNFYDPAGQAFDVYRLEQRANRAKISLRTGCFCNPGANEIAQDLPAQGLEAYLLTQPPPTPTGLNEYMQRHHARVAGATRVSLGLATNFADVYGFVMFLRRLLNKQATDL